MILEQARIPDGLRIFAIGDVHGCFRELKELVARMEVYQKTRPCTENRLVFLGDYVDRGPNNKAVLDYLISLRESDWECIFLKGNHDDRLWRYVQNPPDCQDDIFLWGGLQTFANYGVIPQPGEDRESVASRFLAAFPDQHAGFLESLEISYQCGDYFFCHAGVKPGVPLADQEAHDLMWIREGFLDHTESFGKVIVHGHTPRDEPEILPNRVNVDTRCYDTGNLTALVIEKDRTEILSTGA